ncbi:MULTISPECIES: hypothetical protein [Citrobacter]|uniref:hypothetical protein n=1 Tax=Citrobacter TaxID=544 RepID=UPI0015EAAFD3|nr:MULTISPECIES: hypothetical protein [Citrobacter]EDS0875314.1 hypothetical protein [Salmonella enterica]EJL3896084.1 hypothetical protein [Salmonella enterica]MBA8105444.1 hypothetical protein [Citrobacter sp. RHBSTW-00029]MBJ9569883.1 hypothetical protein [Citrobacter braakii]QMD05999.1 hypothetical protein HVZ52_08115 [Citrobacter sp. RHB36-C18]
MKTNSVETKRHVLNSQPGKQHAFTCASVTHVEMAFAGYMAQHHPEVRTDEVDGWITAYANKNAIV